MALAQQTGILWDNVIEPAIMKWKWSWNLQIDTIVVGYMSDLVQVLAC